MKIFPSIHIEGGLFASDIFEKLLTGELYGQKSRDFGLRGKRGLTDEIAATFSDAKALWQVFKRRLERWDSEKSKTSVTRDAWIIPFLGLLEHELYFQRKAFIVGGLSFAISHTSGNQENAPPVHIVGIDQELGKLSPSGRPRLAPHSLVQEFLNRTEALWGIVTNGKYLRLLRDSTYIKRQCYLEFDLEAIFDQHLFQDFIILFRLLHKSRFPQSGEDVHSCLLEYYYQYSLEQGSRVRDKLRDGVEECIKRLANGFLHHPKNEDLRSYLIPNKDDQKISIIRAKEFYRQLLRLIYRFLFLLVAEDRNLLSSNTLYQKYYSISRLRYFVDKRSSYTNHCDIYHGLKVLWKLLSDDSPMQQIEGKPLAALLDLPVLNGELFSAIELDNCYISNHDLLDALWFLINYQETPNSHPRRINYAALDVEELGSVYESLLDYHPHIKYDGYSFNFELVFGSERKSTGSYYTPSELVSELISSALDPIIQDRLKKAGSSKSEQESAILSIKVVDPACGSGHFLLAAARRLGKELAKIRTGDAEPAPEQVREAIRDVIVHCIYGVDKNPLAVELCKVALWIESHSLGKPLTFLDHKIKCGDSLVGVFDLEVLKNGIPDAAFKPVLGDDKEVVKSFKKTNQRERKIFSVGQTFISFEQVDQIKDLANKAKVLAFIPDDSPESIRKKKAYYNELLRNAEPLRMVCNLWTAAFFQKRDRNTPKEEIITTEAIAKALLSQTIHPQIAAQSETIAHKNHFFHWPIEFPEVFEKGGFDVVLGNPPWERIKLQDKEFFATRKPKIAKASNAATRKKLIKELSQTDPLLLQEYKAALHKADCLSRFLRGSGIFPLTGRGDINTYSVFAERMKSLLNKKGRAGIIVPSGIATDNTNKFFFSELLKNGNLISLYDFENREAIFPHNVHRNYKFCLLTMKGNTDTTEGNKQIQMAFFCTRVEQLRDERRVFTLTPDDIAFINPNTRTLPIFRTRQDAELTQFIYKHIPVLKNEAKAENPWNVRFLRMLDMSNDSHLFRTKKELEDKGYHVIGNRMVKDTEIWFPLYEAKMIWHFDHRFGTYEGVSSRSSTHLPTPDEAQHADPTYLVQPWYWVPQKEVISRLKEWDKGWLLGFRNVTNNTNERTVIFSLMPMSGVGHNAPLFFLKNQTMKLVTICISCLSTLIFDYITRQKIAGINLTFFYIEQLPLLPPDAYTASDLLFIVPRVLELVYTSWDMKPFADDVWESSDEILRGVILKKWKENKNITGGHTWDDIPDWIYAYPEIETNPKQGIPIPPFRWNEERRSFIRAELDAYYAKLYGLNRKQLRYILDPADLTKKELKDILDPYEEVIDPLDPKGYAKRVEMSDFPGETFRVLKEKEMRKFNEYRTRRLVLEAWNSLKEK